MLLRLAGVHGHLHALLKLAHLATFEEYFTSKQANQQAGGSMIEVFNNAQRDVAIAIMLLVRTEM